MDEQDNIKNQLQLDINPRTKESSEPKPETSKTTDKLKQEKKQIETENKEFVRRNLITAGNKLHKLQEEEEKPESEQSIILTEEEENPNEEELEAKSREAQAQVDSLEKQLLLEKKESSKQRKNKKSILESLESRI